MVFPEAVQDLPTYARFAAAVDVPILRTSPNSGQHPCSLAANWRKRESASRSIHFRRSGP
jgi:hypothetical protein